MIIKVKNASTNERLIALFRKELSADCSVLRFGLGKKSILVKKSTFLGVEITIRENEIFVDTSPPSVLGGLLSSLAMTELIVVIGHLFWFAGATPSKFGDFEKEMASLINERYN